MTPHASDRQELVDRLRHTFITADYSEIDALIAALVNKDNYGELCEEFFQGARIDSKGYLVPSGFFGGESKSASLVYAMYEILGRVPETFLLKHRVARIRMLCKDLTGTFRFPRGIFALPNLEVLIVKGIGISQLPEEVVQAKRLRILDLSENRFENFPKSILALPKLLGLDLSFNRLRIIPDGLTRLKGLRSIILQGNQIVQIPADWHRFQYLRKLDLSMNRLDEVPDSLRTIVSLKNLRLAYNELPASEEARWEEEANRTLVGEQGSLDFGS